MSAHSVVSAVVVVTACIVIAACSVDPPRRTVSHSRGGTPAAGGAVGTAPSRPDGSRYTVVRGDTLYSIAFRNQLDFHDLADWNGIGRDYAIRVGQMLRLTPPGSPTLPAERGNETAVVNSAPSRPPAKPPASSMPSSKPVPAAGPTASGAPAQPPARMPSPATIQRADDGGWEWPTRGKVVRGFGSDPSAKGIDITGDRGQIVVASRSGKVVYSGTALKGYGELIIIKHDEQYLSAYGYNRRRLVNEGDSVVAGQPIAEMGDGPEQRPLLHYEIRDRGRPVDPAPLLPARR